MSEYVSSENNDQIPDYLYNVIISFDRPSTATSQNNKYALANKIKMTLSVTLISDGKCVANKDVIVQINPPSADVTIYNVDGSYATPAAEGDYPVTTDANGNVVLYFSSTNNGYQNVQAYVAQNSSSISSEYVIFFGDYTHAQVDVPSPSVDLNEQQILEISDVDPYFYVAITQYDNLVGATNAYSCVAIVNGQYFRKMPYTDALEATGMNVPSAYLQTVSDNQIAYFLENDKGANVVSSPTLKFAAAGTPYNHPKVDPINLPRNLTSRPYLNQGQTSITTSNSANLYVNLDRKLESKNVYTYNAGDTVNFTMYINGFYAGSVVQKVDVFDLEECVVGSGCPPTVSAQIPAYLLEGYGSNIANTPGRYDLDYVVMYEHVTDPKIWGRPVNWLKGNINTVG